MSKVSFRARALDVSKPMPIYRAEEIPDLRDYDKINRAVLQMPTGMEKEEETETHLQNALTAQQFYGTAEARVIPIPEVQDVEERYKKLYPSDYKPSKQYIHIQALGMEQEIPDYDLDSEDETWLNEQKKKMEITPIKFEEMMDRLEKGSGQQVVTLQEAKLLLKEDDDLIIAVYDYWLNKRLRLEMPLIPQVKSEKRDGTTTNNPYVAFRRRTEKMQTRKNRKNDEVSYEKMLKLKRDLTKAATLLELIKRREKSKKEMVQLTIEILEKRYQTEDFSGALLAEAEAERDKHPSFIPPFTFNSRGQPVAAFNGEEVAPVRKKRQYKRRKQTQNQHASAAAAAAAAASFTDMDILHHADLESSDDDLLSPAMSPSDHEDENDPDGPYAFRRKRTCSYYAPLINWLGNWPWCDPEEGGLGDARHRFSLTTLPGGRCIGFARRRVGRGGRVILDRAYTPWDEGLHKVDLTGQSYSGRVGDYITYIREQKLPYYRPQTPPPEDDALRDDSLLSVTGTPRTSTSPSVPEFNLESFQCHREQLMQMQREQEARLLNQDFAGSNSNSTDLSQPANNLQHSFSSQPTSRFTLDSASAEFAVSAVVNTSELSTTGVKSGDNGVVNLGSSLGETSGIRASGDSVTVVSDAAVTIPAPSFISSFSSVTSSMSSIPVSSSLASSLLAAKPQDGLSLSSLQSSQTVQSSSATSLLSQTRPLLLQTSAAQQGLTNGPLSSGSPGPTIPSSTLLQNKNSGLSTSPAASVVQLNFPITTATAPRMAGSPAATVTAIPSTAPSPSVASTPLGTSAGSAPVGKAMVNSKGLTQGVATPSICNLPSSVSSSLDILKQNHEEGSSVHMFSSETPVAMDVS